MENTWKVARFSWMMFHDFWHRRKVSVQFLQLAGSSPSSSSKKAMRHNPRASTSNWMDEPINANFAFFIIKDKGNKTSKLWTELENFANLIPISSSLAANWDTNKKISKVHKTDIFYISYFQMMQISKTISKKADEMSRAIILSPDNSTKKTMYFMQPEPIYYSNAIC